MQSTFRVQIDKGALAPVPQAGSFYEWSIVTDATEIDGIGEAEEEIDVIKSVAEHPNESDPESDDEGDDVLDKENIQSYGQDLEKVDADSDLRNPLPLPGPLKGYEYTKFEPKPYGHDLPGQIRLNPTQDDTLMALHDLKKLLHPDRNTGRGYKDPK
jgi:hypothetical protein